MNASQVSVSRVEVDTDQSPVMPLNVFHWTTHNAMQVILELRMRAVL